jgi:hypothetical protein
MSKQGGGTVFKITVPHRAQPPLSTRASIQARSLLPPNFGVANDGGRQVKVS